MSRLCFVRHACVRVSCFLSPLVTLHSRNKAGGEPGCASPVIRTRIRQAKFTESLSPTSVCGQPPFPGKGLSNDSLTLAVLHGGRFIHFWSLRRTTSRFRLP